MPKGQKEFYKYAGWIATASQWANVTAEVVPIRTDCVEIVTDVDCVIFSGGADISRKWYADASADAPIRDVAEKTYFDYYRGKKPILGICRGMQLINCLLGGTLVQDLKESAGYFPHTEGEHRIFFDDGRVEKTNSYHHQSIDRIGDGIRVLAKAGDGVPEVAEADGIYLVQFHPERETMCWDDYSKEIFRKLL